MVKTAQALSACSAAIAAPSALETAIQSAPDRWREQGYVFLPQVLPSDVCKRVAAEIAAEYDHLSRAGEAFSGGGSISGHLNCFPGQAAAHIPATLEGIGITALLEQLHGGRLQLTSLGCNVNLPGSHIQNFHTDGDWDTRFYVVNIALVPTGRDNGATELVPGTAKTPLRYWRFALGGLWRHGVRRKMRPGDLLIRPSTLWHRGMPNRTDQMRPMLALIYAIKGTAPAADMTLNGGHVQFLANRFASTPLGRIAEVIGVHLPLLHAAIRLVKSLVAPKGRAT